MDGVYFALAVIASLVIVLTVLVGLIANIFQASQVWWGLPAHRQRWLLGVIVVCIILIIPYGYKQLKSDSSPNPSSPTTTSNSITSSWPLAPGSPTPTIAKDSSLVGIPLTIEQPSGQQLSAKLYFGQLGALLQGRTDVGFSTDSNFAQQNGQLCVETVVVSNISGNNAVVYDQRVSGPTGWGGAEAAPPSNMSQTNHIAHQQLIIPPKNISAGTVYVSKAQVVIDQNIKAMTEIYQLNLKNITGSQAQWDVQKSDGTTIGSVNCNV